MKLYNFIFVGLLAEDGRCPIEEVLALECNTKAVQFDFTRAIKDYDACVKIDPDFHRVVSVFDVQNLTSSITS